MEHLEGARVVAIDRIAHRVILSDGTALGYKKLALCTGGRPRPLVCEGMDPAQPRVLARVAGPEVSQFYEDVHLDHGVNLITGTIVVENVFVLPGIGRLVFQAIANRDLVVVRDVVMGLVAVVVVVNFLVDVLYAVVDPRLKASDA